MTRRPRRWHVHCGRDLCIDRRVWLLGLYWQPDPAPRPGQLRWLRYVELRVDTSNPFSLRRGPK